MSKNITKQTTATPVYEDFSKSLTHRRPKPATEMPTSRVVPSKPTQTQNLQTSNQNK